MDRFIALCVIFCVAYAVVFIFAYVWQGGEKINLLRTTAISIWVTIAILTTIYFLLKWWIVQIWPQR